jgi:hypothetical protein
VLIQVVMVALVIIFPKLVTVGLGEQIKVNVEEIQIEVAPDSSVTEEPVIIDGGEAGKEGETPPAGEDDAAKALEKMLKEQK